jgi:hypothetical protein
MRAWLPVSCIVSGVVVPQTVLSSPRPGRDLVILCFLLATHSYADYRRGVPQAKWWLIALAATLWLVLFSTIFLPNSSAFKRVEAAREASTLGWTKTHELASSWHFLIPCSLKNYSRARLIRQVVVEWRRQFSCMTFPKNRAL